MIRFKLELVPEEGVVSPYMKPYGYILRALLMNWFKQVCPEIVHVLHAFNEIRPYSIQVQSRKDHIVFFLNVFRQDMGEALIQDLLRDKHKKFIIDNRELFLKKVVFEHVTLSEILRGARPVKQFRIDFLEPTYFDSSRTKNKVRWPLPELIFGNLINTWNSLEENEEKLDRDTTRDWVNQYIRASSFNIRSKAREMGEKVPAVGAVGWVKYEITSKKPELARVVNFLCKLGEIANTGASRTAGCGVIKYTPLELFKSSMMKKAALVDISS